MSLEPVICRRYKTCNCNWKPKCRHRKPHPEIPDCDEPCNWDESVKPCQPINFVVVGKERQLP